MKTDWVGILEGAYRLDLTTEAWMRGIINAIQPSVDEGLGVAGIVYRVTPEGRLAHHLSHTTSECSTELRNLIKTGLAGLDPEFVKRSYLRVRVGMSSEVPGWRETNTYNLGRGIGVPDALGINGMNPGGTGCLVLAFRATIGRLSPSRRESLARVAVHLATAYRLRLRMAMDLQANPTCQAEAVLDAGGEVHHAVGLATHRPALRALREAVIEVERARGELRHRDPDRALASWKGLVAGRWTLVDHFEHGGRRYVLARDNEPHVHEPGVLSQRERQVVAYATMGRSNKEIAYDLGIAHSTVKVLLFRARAKLGAKNRAELLQILAKHGAM
ncbi:MAG: LuxR C-terminal-related transcriptional regulator [Polyangiaceae bacterium]|jgi:DNA-binding CsgD family transcriptional regulator